MKPAPNMRKKRRGGGVSAFLLPLCPRCGGGMSLVVFEPEPVEGTDERRTYRCDVCGAQDVRQAKRASTPGRLAATS